ncbi:MAG: XdhC family protein, partial [Nitriliruptoraceae bacterium]|nr:XdhC family protein [Nitriliruptoraceae bacterium]
RARRGAAHRAGPDPARGGVRPAGRRNPPPPRGARPPGARPGAPAAPAAREARVPYVHARVVLAEKPTSAKPGDEAIVLDDGTIEGFVGGSCAATTVREQSLASLASGESVLLRITPEPETGDQPGKLVVHNHCLSGGTLEIFLEPALPATLVAVMGSSPIAHALQRLGEAAGFAVQASEATVPEGAAAVVIAAHGHGDEARLIRTALDAGVGYVGLIASPRRGGAVVGMLDLDTAEAARVHTPAGLDLGARTPEEIALSILAQIVAERPAATTPPASACGGHAPAVEADGTVGADDPHGHHADGVQATGPATDPVCGMTVQRSPQALQLDHASVRFEGTVYFCGVGCKQAFAADPSAFEAALLVPVDA